MAVVKERRFGILVGFEGLRQRRGTFVPLSKLRGALLFVLFQCNILSYVGIKLIVGIIEK